MKSFTFLILLLTTTLVSRSQHCPWDCMGMVILDWPAEKKSADYGITLVDLNKNPVKENSTKEAKSSSFMLYELLLEERLKGVQEHQHQWYRYDTSYYFAKGSLVAFFNHCNYYGKVLQVCIQSRNDPGEIYYIPVPDVAMIHLHQTELWHHKTPSEFDAKFKMKIRF